MKQITPRSILFVSALSALFCSSVFSQSADTTKGKRIPREDIGFLKKLTVMPYATISYNIQSGQAFPKSAGGIGYGFGIAFDLTEDKQPLGAYFDFAYQDMRAHAVDGGCARIDNVNGLYQSVPVTHYFSYGLFEGFLKIQTQKSNGYLLLGASAGVATTGLTEKEGAIPDDRFTEWKTVPTYSEFRFDIRAGIGIQFGYISGHQFVIEARFGYPVTHVIGQYADFCNGTGSGGPWRIVTMQVNAGLRL